MVIEVAYSCSCLIRVGKFCEAEAFRSASILIVDDAEVEDCPYSTEDVNDLLLSET